MSIDKLKAFHGPEHSEGPWNSKITSCCKLCKTKSTKGKSRHWAKGLCRSCYRRLSATHRFYNDSWNKENTKSIETRKSSGKKEYKTSGVEIEFSDKDVLSLLERYNFECAYCKTELQDYSHKEVSAFQIEYKIVDDKATLVPICRGCNCSKKNINEEAKLKRWAEEKGIKYPIQFKDPE